MKVINFGSLNYDYTYQVDHMVMPGETLASRGLETHCGGKGFNQSVALARAGIPVCHAGMVGEDGGTFLEICRKEGIDTQFVRTCPGKSGHAIIQVNPAGENCILLYGGANRRNTPEQIEEVLSHCEAGDILLLQNEINLLGELIRGASERKLRIVLNPSPFEEKLLGCGLERVSIFLINETEGMQMTQKTEPEEILSALGRMYPESEFVLTLGEKGVFYADGKGERLYVPACPVKAVDTTAAGDTFTGYYLAGMLQGKEKQELLKRACAAAALAVTKVGAAASIPYAREVDAFLSE